MSEIARYCYDQDSGMWQDHRGDFVSYKDYLALQSELDQLRERNKRLEKAVYLCGVSLIDMKGVARREKWNGAIVDDLTKALEALKGLCEPYKVIETTVSADNACNSPKEVPPTISEPPQTKGE